MTSDTATAAEDEAAVRAVINEVYTAWAGNDADAFVAPYAEDATAQLPGSYLPDRAAIRATMAEAFAGPLKGSRAVHDIRRIRFLAAGAAIVVSRGAVIPAGGSQPDPHSRSLETWVLSRRAEGWRVEAFHNCPEHAA